MLRNLAGDPVDGTYQAVLTLYGAPDKSQVLWTQPVPALVATGGVFSLALDGVDADTFSGPGAWLGVQIEAEPELPATPVLSVPMALVAERALGLQCSGCVGATEIGPDAVGTSELADLSVTTGKLANGAVTTAKLGDDSVTGPKLELTLVKYSFSSLAKPTVIPDSDGAILCALSRVDDDTAQGSCEVYHSSGKWYAENGVADSGQQACSAYCEGRPKSSVDCGTGCCGCGRAGAAMLVATGHQPASLRFSRRRGLARASPSSFDLRFWPTLCIK